MSSPRRWSIFPKDMTLISRAIESSLSFSKTRVKIEDAMDERVNYSIFLDEQEVLRCQSQVVNDVQGRMWVEKQCCKSRLLWLSLRDTSCSLLHHDCWRKNFVFGIKDERLVSWTRRRITSWRQNDIRSANYPTSSNRFAAKMFSRWMHSQVCKESEMNITSLLEPLLETGKPHGKHDERGENNNFRTKNQTRLSWWW